MVLVDARRRCLGSVGVTNKIVTPTVSFAMSDKEPLPMTFELALFNQPTRWTTAHDSVFALVSPQPAARP